MSLFKDKLNLASLLLIVLSLLLWNGLAVSAQDEGENPCAVYYGTFDNLTEEIFAEGGNEAQISLPFSGIFGGSSKKPKVENLYLTVYRELRQTPADDALRSTADRYQYSQTEMCSILSGNYSVLAYSDAGNQNIIELSETVTEMKETFAEEYDKAKRAQEMYLDSYAKEVFANGDTGDSGFDLLYDLEVIEYLLFGEGGYSTTGGGGFDYGDDDEEGAEDEGTETSSETSDDGSGESSDSEDAESSEDSETGESTEETDEEEEEAVDPGSCFVDDAVEAAFQDLIAEAEADEEEAADEGETPEDGEEGSDEDDSSGTSGTGDPDYEIPESSVLAATPKNWTRPKLCDKIFCLFVNFINNEETAYQESDNCIQCHIDYINEAMDETLSKSLMPGKVSGNIMEPAACKRSWAESIAKIDLNFIAIAMPIQTPPSDELITGLNFCDSIGDFVKDEDNEDVLLSLLFKDQCGEDSEAPDELTAEQLLALRQFGNEIDTATKEATTRADEGVSLETLLEEALAIHQNNTAQFEEAFQNSRIEAQMATSTDFFEAMGYEMDQMNNYFRSFYSAISSMQLVAQELSGDLPPAQ